MYTSPCSNYARAGPVQALKKKTAVMSRSDTEMRGRWCALHAGPCEAAAAAVMEACKQLHGRDVAMGNSSLAGMGYIINQLYLIRS